MTGVRVRPLAAPDARAVRAILDSSRSPYDALSRWAMETALTGSGDEARALVAIDERDQPIGLASYGAVGGAQGTARVLGVALSAAAASRSVARVLIEAVVAELRAAGMRLVVAELPDDTDASPLHARLTACAFREVARVPDYFRDGVALVILRRDLAGR